MTETIDFLGIGAQKAATSWLWENLRQHPDIWLPPKKELHYFDRSPAYPSPDYLASDRLFTRLFGKSKGDRKFRKIAPRDIKHAWKNRDWEETRWMLRYYLGTYNDDWYRSLFKNGAGKLMGEITPSYALLDEADVQRISENFPSLKIIFLLRNPIDRAWAQIRYNWTRGKFKNIHDHNKVKDFIDSSSQNLRSDYIRTLNIWSKYFPEEQFFIGFFDDVVRSSQELIHNILEFLEVENTDFTDKKTLDKKVKVSKPLEFPEEIKSYLSRKYFPELQALSSRVGSHATRWLEDAEKHLQSEQDTLPDKSKAQGT